MKKNIKIKLDSHWGSSLKRVLLDDSPMSVFVDSTVSEWFDAKHRITSEKEIQMLNSFEVNQIKTRYELRKYFTDRVFAMYGIVI